MIYRKYVKRLIDINLAIVALIFLCPIFLIIGFLVRVNLGSPVIFKQKRPGLNEKIFTLYKFRTMSNVKDADGVLISDSDRLTVFGKYLRSTSLDELPELWNIVRGDMSFIGPRPLLIQYLPLYNWQQKKRHYVRPGLTGLAQVNGRNAISWEEKFNLDVKYVETYSFVVDIKILLDTIIKVVTREGISSENSATMDLFKGS